MAVVYLARSCGVRGFERQVALKLTHAHLSDEAEFASLALDEARIAARIRHRNVVSILDVGEDPQGIFLVMEYVEGATFSQLLKAKPRMPTAIGVRIVLDALAGLHAAHELRGDDGGLLGVVHRDFSPQNILVGLDGISQLTDFGIAKASDRAGHTSTGVIKGKVAYMAPEQAIGVPVDRRADVWSAGIVTWELFAGRRLYPNGEGVATLLKLLREPPPLLRTVRPDVAPEIEEVVAKALSHRADDRPATAAAFARALAEACAAAGMTAEHEAVAEFAKQAAGARLATRRGQVQEVLKLRVQMEALAKESIDVGAGPGTSVTNAGLALTPSSPVAGESTDIQSGTVTLPNEPSGDGTQTLATEEQISKWRPRRAPRWALVAGAVTALALLAAILTARPARPGHVAAAAASASSPPAAAAAPAAPTPAAPPPSNSAALAVPPDSVDVRANALFASLSINGRSVALAEPRASLTLERAPGERIVDSKVVAVSTDGQRVAAWLHPDSTSLTLTFPKRATASSAPRHAHAGLAPSPYGP